MTARGSRSELTKSMMAGLQRFHGQSVVLSQIIADKVGLSPSDLECLGFLEHDGPTAAGRLGELTGLTSGAVTRMIDRLEARRFVRRRPDPDDRRRVVVELVPGRSKELEPFYGPMGHGSDEWLAQYSDKELALFVGLFGCMFEWGRQHTVRIQALPERPKRRPIKLRAKALSQRVRIRF